jgi:hypothetical protein
MKGDGICLKVSRQGPTYPPSSMETRVNAHGTRERIIGSGHSENDDNKGVFNEDLKSGGINKTRI